jgi:hypothetical protein
MSGEGTAPSKHGRKPEKDDYSGKPAGGQTANANDVEKHTGSQSGKSPSKKDMPGKNPVKSSTRDKGY